jgi:hypothetical protein
LYASLNVIKVIKSKKNEIGRACNTHGRDEKCIQNFGSNLKREVTCEHGNEPAVSIKGGEFLD